MPRRRPDNAAVAESDSFLDIVANIVGILIILIVVVGLRVGQSTIATNAEPVDARPKQPPRPAPVAAPTPIIVEKAAPPAPEPIPVDPKIQKAISQTTAETKRLSDELASVEDRQAELSKHRPLALDELEQLAAAASATTDELAEIEAARQDTAQKAQTLRDEKDRLLQRLDELPEGNVTTLRHELNPIGRAVRGEELHFRLAENRVSHVPLNDFIDRLKRRVREKKDWAARFDRHEDRIGPYNGYSLEYVLEKDNLSLADELRLGSQVMRITVTGWKMIPQETLVSEPAREALQAESRFRQALRFADRGATLTFWVYPDSFEAYRTLQQFVHEKGFDVAARPLPHGVPIAGSPDGSRSSSQ